MKLKLGFVLITVCIAIGLVSCGRTINRSAERKIRDVLPEYLGPAKVWNAHVDSPANRTLSGKLRHLTIDGEQVNLQGIIRCAQLHIDMDEVEFDTNEKRLKSVKKTLFSATIDETGINRYLKDNPPTEDEPVRIKYIELRSNGMYIEATRWMLGKAWPYTMTVQPVLSSKTHLDFSPERMTAVGLPVPLPRSALVWLARRLSQGFDFSTLPFPLRLSSFKVQQGKIVLIGEADVMESLNSRIGKWLPDNNRSSSETE